MKTVKSIFKKEKKKKRKKGEVAIKRGQETTVACTGKTGMHAKVEIKRVITASWSVKKVNRDISSSEK